MQQLEQQQRKRRRRLGQRRHLGRERLRKQRVERRVELGHIFRHLLGRLLWRVFGIVRLEQRHRCRRRRRILVEQRRRELGGLVRRQRRQRGGLVRREQLRGSTEGGAGDGGPGSDGSPSDGSPSDVVPYDGSPSDGSPADGGSGTDATFFEAGPSDAAADVSPLCDPVSLTSAPTVSATTVGTAFPTGGNTGGTIVSGTYYWTAETVYSGGTADPNTKAVVVFDTANMTLRVTNSQSSSASTYTTMNGSSGWAIHGTSLCGSAGGPTILYSVSGAVDAGTFAITTYDSAHGRVETYTLQ